MVQAVDESNSQTTKYCLKVIFVRGYSLFDYEATCRFT